LRERKREREREIERERKREKEKDTFISTAATLTPWATAADLGATEQK
jgi:hypothetical protein